MTGDLNIGLPNFPNCNGHGLCHSDCSRSGKITYQCYLVHTGIPCTACSSNSHDKL